MTIIYFFGPDGTGKSTLTNALAISLKSQGYHVKHSWMRGSHTFASVLARFLSKFYCFRGPDNPYYNIRVPKKIKPLWQFIEFTSSFPVIIFNYLFPSFVKYTVLADRYTLDLVVWLCLTTDDVTFLNNMMSKVLILLAKRTTSRFYVKTDITELKRRAKDTWLTKEQLNLYDKLAFSVDAHVIDTTKNSIETSMQEILDLISLN